MNDFIVTTHISEIIEESNKQPVIIFKYSSECGSSSRLKTELEEEMKAKKINYPIYLVTVQIQKVLSQKISDMFQIKHESPQVIVLNKGSVTYTAHHMDIKTDKFAFEK